MKLPFVPRRHGSTRHLLFSQSDMTLTDPTTDGVASFPLVLLSSLKKHNSGFCYTVNKADVLFCVVRAATISFLSWDRDLQQCLVYVLGAPPKSHPGAPIPQLLQDWLLTGHSCTLPRSRDLPWPAGQHSSARSGRLCTTPPGRADNRRLMDTVTERPSAPSSSGNNYSHSRASRGTRLRQDYN